MSSSSSLSTCTNNKSISKLEYISYRDEKDLEALSELIQKDLSEPYSVFTYRYFVNQWPQLTMMCMDNNDIIGCIVCRLDDHKNSNNSSTTRRGYIAMLTVNNEYRGQHIGTHMVELILQRMNKMNADECVLEAEISNKAALGLYHKLGFIKTKHLPRYYLNGSDAYRLKYYFMKNNNKEDKEEGNDDDVDDDKE